MNFRKLFFAILLLSIVLINQSFSQVIISQYTETETGSFPKGIELWNPTSTTVNFATTPLMVRQGTNGSTTLTTLVTISTGTLAPGEVYVVGTNEIKTYMDLNGINAKFTFHNSQFNGDDALQITVGGVVTDIFGNIGNDPGTEWVGSGVSTANQNIELKSGITSGSLVNWTDPSQRFQTVGPGTDLTGFGVAPGQLQPEPSFEIINTEKFSDMTLGTWVPYSVTSNRNWFASSFSNKTFASMNGFGADAASNDWLISPEFDLSLYQNIKFSFSYQKRNTGPNLDIKISSDYVPGTNPMNATWTILGTVSAAGWAYQSYDISAFDKKGTFVAFHYNSTGTVSGAAAEWNLDELLVTGDFKSGTVAEKMIIVKTNPPVPVQGVPFELIIRAIDENGYPTPLSTNTFIELRKIVGTGSLTGNLSATLPAGTSKISFPGLMYSGNDRLRIRVATPNNKPGPQYLADYEQDFMTVTKPTLTANVYNYAHIGSVLPIEAIALGNDGKFSSNYTGYDVTLSITPATFTGSTKKKMINGNVTFSDIVFTALGTYTVSLSSPYLGTSVNYQVNVINQPAMSEVIVPKVIKGDGAFLENGGTGRIPSLALVKFSGLQANAEYRYTTGITRSIPNNMSNPAGRNMVRKWNENGWQFLSSGKSLTNPAEYSSFKSDASGNAQVWVNVIPDATTDAASGFNVYWLVELGNAYGNVINRFYTTSTSKTVQIGYGVTQASGIYESRSTMNPTNIVALYDQNNAVITTAIVQDDGATLQTPGFLHQAPWFYANYENSKGAWATVIPNDLPGGVRRISELDKNGNIIKSFTDDDGVWAGYVTEGSNYAMNPPAEVVGQIYFATPYLKFTNVATGTKVCNTGKPFELMFDNRGVSLAHIWVAKDNNPYELLAGNVDLRNNKYDWNIIRSMFRNSNLKIKVQSVEHTYTMDEVLNFNIYDTPVITGTSQSKVMCLNSAASLQVEADGSNLKYQWYKDGDMMKDGNGVIGTNTELLRFSNVSQANSGTYYAIVTGDATCKTEKSQTMTLYVATPTKVVSPTKDTDIGYQNGEKTFLTFLLHIGGQIADDVTLQNYNVKISWYKMQGPGLPDYLITNDNKYAGANSNILSIKNISSVDAGTYFAKIWTVCGDTTVTLKYHLKEIKLDAAEKSADSAICETSEITLKSEFVSSINTPILYSWYKDGVQLANNNYYSGVHTKELHIINAKPIHTGIYKLVASMKEYDNVSAETLTEITVKPLPVIESTSAVQELRVGQELNISVVAKGGDLTYTWLKNGVEINGATTNSLVIASVSLDDAGDYTCVVTNECGSIESKKINLVVSTGGISGINEVENNGWKMSSAIPNPVNESSFINVFANETAIANITISDISGYEINTNSVELNNGWNRLNIDANNLSSGTYLITLTSGNTRLTQKITVIK